MLLHLEVIQGHAEGARENIEEYRRQSPAEAVRDIEKKSKQQTNTQKKIGMTSWQNADTVIATHVTHTQSTAQIQARGQNSSEERQKK